MYVKCFYVRGTKKFDISNKILKFTTVLTFKQFYMSEKFRGLSNKEIQLRIAQLSVEINERSSEINELI